MGEDKDVLEERNIYERLLIVQNELKAPKGQRNDFGKYNYRSAEDILNAVKPLNVKQELTLTITDNILLIGERYYVEATAKVTCGSESIEVKAYARESAVKKGMDESQITGSASSYARKYALNGLYLIDDTKDSDTNEQKQQIDRAKTISKAKQDKLISNFSRIAELRKKSINTVEASFLSMFEFGGEVKDLDDHIYLNVLKATEDNIKKIEKEMLTETAYQK